MTDKEYMTKADVREFVNNQVDHAFSRLVDKINHVEKLITQRLELEDRALIKAEAIEFKSKKQVSDDIEKIVKKVLELSRGSSLLSGTFRGAGLTVMVVFELIILILLAIKAFM